MTGTWVRICPVDEVRTGVPVGRTVGDSDQHRVCVVRRNDGSHVAMLDRCPHRDIFLSGGIVDDDHLVCPGHFWRFDLRSGSRVDLPSCAATLYPTRVADGWVEAVLPPPPPRLPMREWLLAQARARRSPMTTPAPPSTSPEIGDSIDVGGIRTNYHDEGAGPPVVLVHGSGPGVSAYANWRLTLPALASRFRLLAPDVLGFGFTERPTGVRYDLDSWLDHLVGFLDALGLERVSLVGNSFGGALAMGLTLRHPERVERLVLMGSVGVPFSITSGLEAVWGFEPSLPSMRALLDLFAYDRSLVSDDLAALRLAAATRPGVHEAFAAMFPAPRQRALDAMTLDESRIRSISQETLILHGRDDQVIPLANSLRLHQLIDRSQLHVFGRCGHWVQIEHAAAFNRIVAEFLG